MSIGICNGRKRAKARSVREPRTRAEWQQAVDLAEAVLTLDSNSLRGLLFGHGLIDERRCERILCRGRWLGILPRQDALERLVKAMER